MIQRMTHARKCQTARNVQETQNVPMMQAMNVGNEPVEVLTLKVQTAVIAKRQPATIPQGATMDTNAFLSLLRNTPIKSDVLHMKDSNTVQRHSVEYNTHDSYTMRIEHLQRICILSTNTT
mmetsp:Transcript_1676/g.2389  ORF Transcript_1676/g.2389 Transcript_1676/m.2389 type:complete len:121 (+) Transcript_1676:174-536(+)